MLRATGIIKGIQRFLADERGSAGMEFVVSLPLLMGVMVLSAEYGRALALREALDSGLRDAARLLARAPADIAQDAEGNNIPKAHSYFLDLAVDMVADRTGVSRDTVYFGYKFQQVDNSNFRMPYYVLTVYSEIDATLPLLSIMSVYDKSAACNLSLNEYSENGYPVRRELNRSKCDGQTSLKTTLRMSALDTVRYIGAVPLGEGACSFVSQGLGEC